MSFQALGGLASTIICAEVGNCEILDLLVNSEVDLNATKTVADQGFPRGGGANSQRGRGRQPIIWPTFPKNCMKMKKFGVGGASLPLRSATVRLMEHMLLKGVMLNVRSIS